MLLNPGAKLRELLAKKEIVIAPGVYDGISGVVIEQAGFQAAYLTGAGIAAGAIGEPDIGLTSATEIANVAKVVSTKVEIPIICDADTGFGNPLNVIRTVHELERVGVAAIQMEDQLMPKRCGHLNGKTLIPADDMVQKMKAAVNEKFYKDTVIIARTDARAVDGFDAAVERSKRYIDAGIDVLFFEAPQSVDEIEQIAKIFGGQIPLLSNQVYGGKTPSLTAQELEQLGYSLVIFPSTMPYAATVLLRQVADRLKAQGSDKEVIPGGDNAMDQFITMGLREWQALEQKYKD
ncbi:MAG: isocitrate lyase/phosphoenolpyruvate mutase family protein [Clostridiales Family XIII bacterium]|jgi:2-methylisocitrate lyase-like PEP mutase family enzyme|nr:isocitrate lyase/phosphoenolpyruvate mutase family protein [Clostridiales Family XIII bacterium]